MRKVLLAATILAASGASPAFAANTAITLWTSGDVGDAVTETGTNGVDVGPQNLDGVTITLTFANRLTKPNDLTEGTINIDNTTGTTQTLNIITGANGYAGPSSTFALSGTILASLGVADFKGAFFVDGADTLNGLNIGPVIGTQVNNFDSHSITGPESFSFNGFGHDGVAGPYGMAELLTLQLAPGASVAVDSMSMDAVPEPRTWALMALGFGVMAYLGYRRRPTARLATI